MRNLDTYSYKYNPIYLSQRRRPGVPPFQQIQEGMEITSEIATSLNANLAPRPRQIDSFARPLDQQHLTSSFGSSKSSRSALHCFKVAVPFSQLASLCSSAYCKVSLTASMITCSHSRSQSNAPTHSPRRRKSSSPLPQGQRAVSGTLTSQRGKLCHSAPSA